MTEQLAANTSASHVFSFGDPEPILKNKMTDYLGIFIDISGDFYRPPISFDGLANLMNANAHHGPILHFKKNMVLKYFEPTKYMSYATMQKLALDYVVFGNMYPQRFVNGFEKITRAGHLPAIAMRRGKKQGQFFQLKSGGEKTEFKPGEVIHILEPGVKQGIYGEPEYLGGIQSVLLSEDSTLFRRKYYINGAHMGYILVTNDADLDDKTAKIIEEKVKESKGPGNFRSIYLNIGKSNAKEPVQVIPVGDIGTKDEFERIKNVTLVEMLAMHRMQPGLSGVTPNNTGGFGDIKKTMEVYYELEVVPLQKPFLEINEHLGVEAVKFKKPEWSGDV